MTTTYTWDLSAQLPVVFQEGDISYVYGLGLISQSDGTTQSYFLADGLGSTAALTDDQGGVSATYKYDVFGAIKSATGTGSTDFRFAGQQDDPALGYQYLRARYYDPEIGRFISRDPIPGKLVKPQTQTPYTYVENSPGNLTDPSGACPWCLGAAIVAGGGILGSLGAGIAAVAGGKSGKEVLQAMAVGGGAGMVTAGSALLGVPAVTSLWFVPSLIGVGGASSAMGNAAGQIAINRGFKNFDKGQVGYSFIGGSLAGLGAGGATTVAGGLAAGAGVGFVFDLMVAVSGIQDMTVGTCNP